LPTCHAAVGSARGAKTLYSHHDAGNRRLVTALKGVIAECSHDAANQPEQVVNRSGQQWVVKLEGIPEKRPPDSGCSRIASRTVISACHASSP